MKAVAIFKESDLEFVAIVSSHAQAAEIIFGNRRHNANIQKYINGKINSLAGHIVVPVDFTGIISEELVEKARLEGLALAKKRKDRTTIFKINNDLINELSDEDAAAITKILLRYEVNK